jgi:cholesterol oxidase
MLVNIEDAGIPPMFASLVQNTLDLLSNQKKGDVVDMLGLLWNEGKLPDYIDPTSMQTESEMLMNVCWFNVMGADDASGKFDLHNGSLRLRFEQKISDHPTFKKAEIVLQGIAQAVGGKYRPFPLWEGLEPFISRKLVVVHPLGGCPIGGSSSDGVVNGNGQVFDTKSGGQSVHKGLHVIDASIIPGALAVNPTLSIVSMAVRAAANIA